jgi:hypothetical protein
MRASPQGWAYAGDAGILAGVSWATLCNFQRSLAYYRKPWTHVGGAVVGYYIFKAAAAFEDHQLQNIIASYERKGYIVPEERKKLFEPRQYT